MRKLFEVPYNFNESLIRFYKKNTECISFLFIPPYKDDSINTRSSIETRKVDHCYMPQSRLEYESHLRKIADSKLRFVILWQMPGKTISKDILNYYEKLGTSGYIVANDANARIIKDYDSKLLVIGSLVQKINVDILKKKDLQYYDYVVLYYPVNRSLDSLKELISIKDKIVIMPNTFCHIDCPSVHHWFPTKERPFELKRDCLALTDSDKYLDKCGFISPEHLFLFDNYVGGYKLQGREYSADIIKHICNIYFKRLSPNILLDAMLGNDLSKRFRMNMKSQSASEYYNKSLKKK